LSPLVKGKGQQTRGWLWKRERTHPGALRHLFDGRDWESLSMGSVTLSVQSARNLVLQHCRSIAERPAVERVALLESFHRVLAETVTLDSDQPPFARAMRDGFALRAEETQAAPVSLRCIGEVRAGETVQIPLRAGEALQIMTGAPVPEGANAVVMVEDTARDSGTRVQVLKPVRTGENVAPRGSERRAGDTVLEPGRRISPLEAAVLAAAGKAEVLVYRRPIVGILATGDELVGVMDTPRAGQIRNSNSYSLYGQVLRSGGSPVMLDTARDNLPDLRRQIQRGLEFGILLVSGGVSMGKYDLVEPVFEELGVEVHFESVSMRPGKPTVFATWKDRWVFGLPGNPLSTFVAFELFVRPVLRALQGLPAADLQVVRGQLRADVVERSGRSAFLPAVISSGPDSLEILPAGWMGSADVFGAVKSNGLLIVPAEAARLNQGESVEALLFEELQYATEVRL
jgi:molybdopterin molybdotransferase